MVTGEVHIDDNQRAGVQETGIQMWLEERESRERAERAAINWCEQARDNHKKAIIWMVCAVVFFALTAIEAVCLWGK